MGDRIAILRQGGVLAQYDTPDAILAHPADEFVAQFIGEDRALRRLALRTLADVELQPNVAGMEPTVAASPTTTLRNAVSLMLESDTDALLVDDDGDGARRLPPRRRGGLAVSDGRRRPGDPELREGSSCVTGDHTFCWDWVHEHWHDTLGPALVAAPRADGDRGRDRLRARVRARAARAPRTAGSSSRSGRLRTALHDPEPRALPAARAVHRAHPDDGRDRARRVHARDPLPEHPRRACGARRRTCSRRRAGWA